MPSVLLLEAVCVCLLAGAPPSLPLQEVQVSRETLGKISAASKTAWCSAAVDVLFLVDGSHSVGKGSFERAKHFAVTVCDALDVHPERDGYVVTVGGDEPAGRVAVVSVCDTLVGSASILLKAVLAARRRAVELSLLQIISSEFKGLASSSLSLGQVRVGAVQFSSAPWLEFPLDSSSTQQEVKAKLKRMVFKGGRTETGLALKYFLHSGFPGGRNASVPRVLIIVTDGRSQGHVALPAQQLQERGVTVFAVGVRFPRWEELHTLASEPREQHVLMAGPAEDAANGLFSTLSRSDLCSFASPDCRVQPHPCERKTLETVQGACGQRPVLERIAGDRRCAGGTLPLLQLEESVLTPPPPPATGPPARPLRLAALPERRHVRSRRTGQVPLLCPPAFSEEADCAPTLSLACRIDVLFLLASSAGTTPEGFLRAKAFVRRFAQASLNEDSRARVGVARFGGELEVAVPVGEYLDVPDLVRSLDAIPFGGGATRTGSALRQAAERGFGSARTGLDRPRRVLVLITESPSEDEVAGPARHARARELLLLGLGSEAVRAELEEITGSPERVLVYADRQDLFRQIPELQGKLCSRPRPGCRAQSLDLVFMLDASASVGPQNFARMQSFVRSCALQFDVNPDVTQIGLVVYGRRVQTAFGLDSHVARPAVLRAASQAPYLGGAGSAGTALLHVHDRVMTVQRGARPGVPKAVVMLSGGGGVEDAAVPAQKLRDNGVSVLVVGVGPVLSEALRRLAGPRDALIHAAAYTDLRFHRDALIQWLCEEASRPVDLCRPSPCMHEGTCILRNGSYLCACRDGWEGPHCESRALRGDALKTGGQPPSPSQQLQRPGHPGR